MITTLVCNDVRPVSENSKRFVVVASQDERGSIRAIDPTVASNIVEAREKLKGEGIVLGGSLQPVRKSSTESSLTPPVEVIAHDEFGNEHRLIADSLEEYSLSSGSSLYYLYIPEGASDCRWLVGHALKVGELKSKADLAFAEAILKRPLVFYSEANSLRDVLALLHGVAVGRYPPHGSGFLPGFNQFINKRFNTGPRWDYRVLLEQFGDKPLDEARSAILELLEEWKSSNRDAQEAE